MLLRRVPSSSVLMKSEGMTCPSTNMPLNWEYPEMFGNEMDYIIENDDKCVVSSIFVDFGDSMFHRL